MAVLVPPPRAQRVGRLFPGLVLYGGSDGMILLARASGQRRHPGSVTFIRERPGTKAVSNATITETRWCSQLAFVEDHGVDGAWPTRTADRGVPRPLELAGQLR